MNLFLRQWNKNPPSGYSAMTWKTKMTDFNNPYSKKSILEFIINLSNVKSIEAFGAMFVIISYRTKLKQDFSILTVFGVGMSGFDYMNADGQTIRKKINNLHSLHLVQFEFKIVTQGTHAGINDMNIVYREHRDVSTDRLVGD